MLTNCLRIQRAQFVVLLTQFNNKFINKTVFCRYLKQIFLEIFNTIPNDDVFFSFFGTTNDYYSVEKSFSLI